MAYLSKGLQERATAYATAHGLELEYSLGGGKDGNVYSTSAQTAIKVFWQPETFRRERWCYERLKEMDVVEVLGHNVPRLRGVDEARQIIEITIVPPPYLLDFASAYLDYPPDFPDEVIEEWQHAKHDEFGEHWGTVLVMLKVLEEEYGIFMLDVHPGNIAFETPD